LVVTGCSKHYADISFASVLIEWRGPAPFYFVAVPDELVGEIRYAARQASYGWGVVPITAEICGMFFKTSLFPKDSGYLVPLRDAIRREAGIKLGDRIAVRLRVVANSAGSPARPGKR
jgi:hypothetical protein